MTGRLRTPSRTRDDERTQRDPAAHRKPRDGAAMSLQALAGNRAVTALLGRSARTPAVQREFVDAGETGQNTVEPAPGEVVQPDLGEHAEAANPTAESVNEFGEMDGSIGTNVVPHTLLNRGQVATGKWHHAGGSGGVGNQFVGSADLVAPEYDSAPPKKAGGQATARVRKGTGTVKVTRSYNGVTPGDNGNAAWSGSTGGPVFVFWSAVARMAKHEAGHIKETKKTHDSHIKPLEKRVREKKGGATEADAVAALKSHVDWNTGVTNFANEDTAVNIPGGTWDTTDQAKANFYHDKGPRKIKKKDYSHVIEAP